MCISITNIIKELTLATSVTFVVERLSDLNGKTKNANQVALWRWRKKVAEPRLSEGMLLINLHAKHVRNEIPV